MQREDRVIFISSFHSFVTKNVLSTEAFSMLKKDERLRIYILVPEHKVEFFRNIYAGDRVGILGLGGDYLNRGKIKFFSRLFMLIIDSHYLWYKKRERLQANKSFYSFAKYVAEVCSTKLLKHLYILHPILRMLFVKFSEVHEISTLFEKYRPNLIFVTDVFDETDTLLASEARRRSVEIIGMVRSWDNCYSKGLMKVVPKKLIVNSQTIKDEAINMHGVQPDRVYVLGSPQYDSFINNKRASRQTFCERVGLNPDFPYILFAPAGKILSDTDDQIVDIFISARNAGELPKTLQLLVRNHPGHPADLDRFIGQSGVVIENPGRRFNTNNPKDSELTAEDNAHLADEMYYSDVVIWVATTLPLDAVIFDKPLISINFDGYESKAYYESVRKYHDEDHMKKMLDLGGVKIVNSREEFINAIREYLRDPKIDQEGRELIRKQQFYKLDGKAGKRIGEFVLEQVRS